MKGICKVPVIGKYDCEFFFLKSYAWFTVPIIFEAVYATQRRIKKVLVSQKQRANSHQNKYDFDRQMHSYRKNVHEIASEQVLA